MLLHSSPSVNIHINNHNSGDYLAHPYYEESCWDPIKKGGMSRAWAIGASLRISTPGGEVVQDPCGRERIAGPGGIFVGCPVHELTAVVMGRN